MAPTIPPLNSLYIFTSQFFLHSFLSSLAPSHGQNNNARARNATRGPSAVHNPCFPAGCPTAHPASHAVLDIQPKYRAFGRRDDSDTSPTTDPASTPTTPPVAQASEIHSPPPPYTPTIPLHATQLPAAPNNQGALDNHRQIGIPDSKLAFTITAVLFCIIFACTIASIIWGIWRHGGGRKKAKAAVPRWLCLGRARRIKSGIEWKFEMADSKGGRVDYDDRTWGTPTLGKEEGAADAGEPPKNLARRSWYRDSSSFGDFWLLGAAKRLSAPVNASTMQHPITVHRVETRAVSMPPPPRKASHLLPKSVSHAMSKTASIALETIAEDEEEGSDIAHALATAFQNCGDSSTCLSTSDSHSSTSAEYSHNEADTLTKLSLRAGMQSVGKRESCAVSMKGRGRQGSDASAETHGTTCTTVELEAFEDSLGSANSNSTSMASFSDDLGLEGSTSAEDMEAEVVQARRVQTKSMEVKKGILLSMGMPSFILSRPSSSVQLGPEECDVTERVDGDAWLYTPSMSTGSICTAESGTTFASVNLEDFPCPPSFPAST